jgi:FKBP-type peptidyl-prolyl cis-trans isomerase SlyD
MSPARMVFAVILLVVSVPVGAVAQTTPAAPSSGVTVEKGSTVKLEYTLKDDAGIVLDSNKGQDPLTFTQGSAQLMPGLEQQIIGMHAGEEKKVVLKPEDAFGLTDPSAQAEVPKGMLPPESLTVGTRLMARNASGEQRPVTIKEVKQETVILDLNHPLAGKTLVFELKVLGVEPPKAAEPPKAVESPTPAEPSKAVESPKAVEPPKAAEPKSN